MQQARSRSTALGGTREETLGRRDHGGWADEVHTLRADCSALTASEDPAGAARDSGPQHLVALGATPGAKTLLIARPKEMDRRSTLADCEVQRATI